MCIYIYICMIVRVYIYIIYNIYNNSKNKTYIYTQVGFEPIPRNRNFHYLLKASCSFADPGHGEVRSPYATGGF